MTEVFLKRMGVNKEVYPFFFDMWNTLVAYFGEDRVDYQSRANEIRFIIHYPTLVIKNSLNAEHKCRDFFAFINVSTEALLLGFKYSKSTFTYREACSGYIHSHATTSKIIDNGRLVAFSISEIQNGKSVCVGDGPIRFSRGELQTRYDTARFLTFIVELDMNIQWESLEGGPHIKFGNIASSAAIASSMYETRVSTLKYPHDKICGGAVLEKPNIHRPGTTTLRGTNILPIASYFAYKLLDTHGITATQILDNTGNPKIHICNSDEEISNKILVLYNELAPSDKQFFRFILCLPNIGSNVFEAVVSKKEPYFGIINKEYIKFKDRYFPLIILRPDAIFSRDEQMELTSDIKVSTVVLKIIKELIVQSYIFTN